MSLNKITIQGKVKTSPELRHTDNNFPIASFYLELKESSIRVISKGKLAEKAANTIKQYDTVIIEGKLLSAVQKTNTGENKTLQIEMSNFEVVILPGQISPDAFIDETGYSDPEGLIGEDEIPF